MVLRDSVGIDISLDLDLTGMGNKRGSKGGAPDSVIPKQGEINIAADTDTDADTALSNISNIEIVARCLFPMINRGFELIGDSLDSTNNSSDDNNMNINMLAEPEEVDLAFVHLFGFKRFKGM